MNTINDKNATIKFYFLVFILALINFAGISYFGMVQFGGYDGSILINHAWQSELNYEPYFDIVTGWPPILLIGARFAFKVWGVRWASLVYIAACFSFVTFIYQAQLLVKLGYTRGFVVLGTFVVQAVTMVVISWWWYNNISAVIAVVFILSSALLIKDSADWQVRLNFVAATVLLLLCKPNVTVGVLCLALCVLFWSRQTRVFSLASLAVSCVIVILILKLLEIDILYLFDSYSMYASTSLTFERIIRFLFLNNYTEVSQTLLSLLPGFLAVLLVLTPPPSSNSRVIVDDLLSDKIRLQSVLVGLASMIAGVWAMMTNNEYNMTDASLVFIGILVVVHNLKHRFSLNSNLPLILVAVSSFALSLNGWHYAAQRNRVMDVGPGAFYEDAPLTRISTPSLFNGMLASPRLIRVFSQIERVLRDYSYLNQPDAPVFFGPRIDFGYAAYGIYPYRGLPTWWEFFSEDGDERTDSMVARFKYAEFYLCIFLKNDYTYMPQSILDHLNEQYVKYETQDLTVYVRK